MLKELRKKLDSKEIGAAELTKEYLRKIKEDTCNSFITVCEEEAIRAANKAQELINSGNSTALTGIPVSIKDNICTKDILTTCASKMLENFSPIYDADVVKKLKDENAVILGKTNMDEFAMGSNSQNSYFKGVLNPLDNEKSPGGSSGGAAASVSSGLCTAALGSDTGGSVRQPASYCGMVGIKPSYGRVSRYGLVAFASSLEQIGTITKTVSDGAIMLGAICGKSENDMNARHSSDFTAKYTSDIKGIKIAVPKEFFTNAIDSEISKTVLNAVHEAEKSGAQIFECSIPSLEYALSAYYLISSAEAASNLARFDGIKYGHKSTLGDDFNSNTEHSRAEGFGKEVKKRILLGNYALSEKYYDEYYKKALKVKNQIKKEYDTVFSECDAIITPTSSISVPKISQIDKNPVSSYISDLCTVCDNLTGNPSVSIPCGKDKSGMPIGMSITGKMFDEANIIGIANYFEKHISEVTR